MKDNKFLVLKSTDGSVRIGVGTSSKRLEWAKFKGVVLKEVKPDCNNCATDDGFCDQDPSKFEQDRDKTSYHNGNIYCKEFAPGGFGSIDGPKKPHFNECVYINGKWYKPINK